MPAISIIVPCFNQEKYIADCLDSVLVQTFSDYEVIIVNDGSTDDSLRIIQNYTRKYHNFKVINQKNSGVISARNNGCAYASGEYLFLLDGDDVIAPDMLKKSFEAINNGLGDIITSRVMLFGECSEKELQLHEPDKWNISSSNCLVNSALLRKKDFEVVHGYDPQFVKGLEDYDLWLNMVFRRGLKIYRIPEILFYYRMKREDESRNLQSREYTKQLRKLIIKKYPEIRFYKIGNKLRKLFHCIKK